MNNNFKKFCFKEKFTESQRKEEAARITAKYPNRIPVICERNAQAIGSLPDVDKRKYLVPDDLTSNFLFYRCCTILTSELKLSKIRLPSNNFFPP
jgi:hypothetical protein